MSFNRSNGLRMTLAALLLLPSLFPSPALAQLRPSLADSFRLGSGGGVLCQVQNSGRDFAIKGMFDRAWAIVCRDAARPIGKLYGLRHGPDDAAARLAALRRDQATCGAPAAATVPGLANVRVAECTLTDAPVAYRVYSHDDGKTLWVAEGLAGYDSALTLGLRTVVADRPTDGRIAIATTSIADPVAFARVQAGTLDPDRALAEGYRRNNSGDYAEAAEFFATLQTRAETERQGNGDRTAEYLINRALQKSNLGEFAEADALFAEAARYPSVGRVQSRLKRNFEALHLLNQRKFDAALTVLDRSVAPLGDRIPLAGNAVEIGPRLASEINNGLPAAQRLGATDSGGLTSDERATILDAQALQLRGTALRLKGQPAQARALIARALTDATAVRDGRVISISRLRAQMMAEIALAYEDEGDTGAAERLLREAVALVEARYPQTAALNGARARLAAYLARHGQAQAATDIYRQVVATALASGAPTTGLDNLLAPYFAILVEGSAAKPELVGDFFTATQTLVRPGVADTQAVLSRELSEGGGEAARLFRQSLTLSRDIERNRIEAARLTALGADAPQSAASVALIERDIASLEREQANTQAALSAFPQFRALSTQPMTLADLKATLKPGEAYLKLAVVGPRVYGLYVSPTEASAWRLPIASSELDRTVDALRATISSEENGALQTYPFDVTLARKLFVEMMGPNAAKLAGVTHLVFEPDGAMLRLPVNLLVTDDTGVAAYAARIARPDADQFDFRGIAWLGRDRAVSTAVSARAFRDARQTPASKATAQYLGFGQNAPVSNMVRLASTRSVSGAGAVDCSWPVAEWNKPISASELRRVQALVGRGGSDLVTGAAFTDTAVMARPDLANYRILHFATHGLVTAPRPSCPARPALLTSFGSQGSDGLLTFAEIYDLKLDADLVILSACDTAGKATVAATREAGVTSGGGSALDGLVRAFIGAGGRSVLASHWPAPDDFKATERLITGIFEAPPGASIGESLRRAEVALMDDPVTSHPYYWSGFAIVGDGARPLLAAR